MEAMDDGGRPWAIQPLVPPVTETASTPRLRNQPATVLLRMPRVHTM
ncbi:MAG TPA: hypothetical protein VI248_04135 [Kineosporiaceae bacterium]